MKTILAILSTLAVTSSFAGSINCQLTSYTVSGKKLQEKTISCSDEAQPFDVASTCMSKGDEAFIEYFKVESFCRKDTCTVNVTDETQITNRAIVFKDAFEKNLFEKIFNDESKGEYTFLQRYVKFGDNEEDLAQNLECTYNEESPEEFLSGVTF